MYINATGTNPTGIIIPQERRKEIYKIACDYNFLLLDDDPYHFMHFDKVSHFHVRQTNVLFDIDRYIKKLSRTYKYKITYNITLINVLNSQVCRDKF